MPSAHELSWASFSALGDGLSSGYYLRADPVSLQADLAQVYLRGHAELDLNTEEVTQLVQEMNKHVQQDQLKLVAPHKHRWYLQLTKPAQLKTQAWTSLLNQPINEFLSGETETYWQRLFTELQMILYTSSVNQQRRQQGKATVDALWFFGSESLREDKSFKDPVTELWTDSPWAKGLALHHKIPVMDLVNLDELKYSFGKNAVIYSETTSLEAVTDLALIELKQGRINALTLHPCQRKSYQFSLRENWIRRIVECFIRS